MFFHVLLHMKLANVGLRDYIVLLTQPYQLFTFCGGFHATPAELSNCDRKFMALDHLLWTFTEKVCQPLLCIKKKNYSIILTMTAQIIVSKSGKGRFRH